MNPQSYVAFPMPDAVENRLWPVAKGPLMQRRRKMRVSSWIMSLAGVAALVLVVMRFGDIEAFGEALRRARPSWLAAAIACQVATYVSVAAGWSSVLVRARAPQPIGRLVPIAITKLFADQALPGAGMGGNLLLVDQLTARGVPRPAAVAALLVSMVGNYLAYAVLALAMLILLWLHGRATPLLVGVTTSFLLVAFAVPALALWLRRRGSRPLPRRIEHLQPLARLLHVVGEAPPELLADRGLLVRVALLNGAVFLADTTTLVLVGWAFGGAVGLDTAFIALMVASIVVTLAPFPLGLGGFEASCTAMLTMLGTPSPLALAITLAFRGLALWMPLVLGFLLLRQSLRTRARPRRPPV